MSLEIERKFLLKQLPPGLTEKYFISQGYLLENPVVRIRKSNDSYYLTIKNKSSGLVRKEKEYTINKFLYSFLMIFCKSKIFKIRFKYFHKGLYWEIDYFKEDLIIAEIELPQENYIFENPFQEYVIKEVTFDKQYSNLELSKVL